MSTSTAPSIAAGFKEVLFATDFSEEAQHALGYAKSIVRASDGELILVHVATPEPHIAIPEGEWFDDPLQSQRECGETDAEGQALREEGFRVSAICPFGDTAEEIANAVRNRHADLVVVGTHGRTGMRRLLLGSHAQRLAGHLTVPLLIVGPKAPPQQSLCWRPQQCLCAASLDDRGAHLVAEAYRLARRQDAHLDVAYKDFSTTIKKYSDWEHFKREIKRELRSEHGDKLHLQATFLDEPEEGSLVELARAKHADLLIMEHQHQLFDWGHSRTGSSLPHLLAEAPCPILVMPTIVS